jgi:hypothetical protein
MEYKDASGIGNQWDTRQHIEITTSDFVLKVEVHVIKKLEKSVLVDVVQSWKKKKTTWHSITTVANTA